jgi:hypothetical protein
MSSKSRKRRKRRGSRPPQQQRLDPQSAEENRSAEPARRRTARNEPPPAPWGSFPLSELTIFVGLVMLIAGFISGGNQGLVLIGVGVVLGSLGGLEVSVREHFAGYRSHTIVLALAAAVLTAAVVTVVTTLAFDEVLLVIPVAAGVVMFGAAVYVLRGAFRRASGGLSFRVGGLRG